MRRAGHPALTYIVATGRSRREPARLRHLDPTDLHPARRDDKLADERREFAILATGRKMPRVGEIHITPRTVVDRSSRDCGAAVRTDGTA